MLSRLRLWTGQFRRRPEPAEAETEAARAFARPDWLRSYLDAAGSGLYESERELCERHLAPGSRILDVGCGAGREAFGFARRGYSVVGLDACPEIVEAARAAAATLPSGAASFRVMGLSALDLPGERFDAAYLSSDVYAGLPGRANRVASLRRLARLLRPGGVLVLPVSPREPSPRWRLLVGGPRAAWRWLSPRRAPEPGDAWFPAPGDPSGPSLFRHHFASGAEVEAELAEVGFEVVDRISSFFVARAPGARRYHTPRGVTTAAAGPDLLLVDLDRGTAYRLNPTARAMWERLSSGSTVAEAALALEARLGAPRERIAADAEKLAAELVEGALLEPRPEGP